MTDKFDEVKQDIADIAEAVSTMKDEAPEAIVEKLEAPLNDAIRKQAQVLIDENEAKRPKRKGEFVGPEGFQYMEKGIVPEGKYRGHRYVDIEAAGAILQEAKKLDREVKLPSEEMTKILDPGTDGSGGDFTFTGLADTLWDDTFLQNKIVSALGGPFNMPTDPFKAPLIGEVVYRKGTRSEAGAAQDPATADSTLATTKLIAEVNWNYEMDEDSVIAMMPELRRNLSRTGSEYMDRFVLNADATSAATGNINSDDAAPDADSYYLRDASGQDGIRHQYLVDDTDQSTDIGATLTDALMRAGISRMGKYGVTPSENILITDAKTYLLSILSLDDVSTLDKFGPSASVLTGQIGAYAGIPILVSEAMLLAEDDGKVSATAANNDEGQIAFTNVNHWRVGFKRQLMLEVAKDIQRQIWIIVASFRIAVAARDRTSTHTAGIHGINFS
jgi:hypothetical protein